MTSKNTIGAWIREHRRRKGKGKGWTQEQLAGLLGVGRTTLSWWERGQAVQAPARDMAVRMAQVFGLPVVEVLRAWGYPVDDAPSEEVDRLNIEEAEWLELFRELPPAHRELQLSGLRGLLETLRRQGQ